MAGDGGVGGSRRQNLEPGRETLLRTVEAPGSKLPESQQGQGPDLVRILERNEHFKFEGKGSDCY